MMPEETRRKRAVQVKTRHRKDTDYSIDDKAVGLLTWVVSE
jgi:hypothetical protein